MERVKHALGCATHHSPHLEHLGFVAYAGCETLGLAHALIYAVSVWLFVWGALALWLEVRA